MSILHDHLTSMILERGKLDAAITLLQKLEAGNIPAGRKPNNIPQEVLQPLGETPAPKKHKFSAASRRKMAASQKARWAKLKGAVPAGPKKRRMSAAGRKRIAAATKARWAVVKAEGQNNLNAKPAKKVKAAAKSMAAGG